MEINITLIIQMLVFGAFVWFTMKFVWPPLVRAMEERQEKIAAGLSAAERGQRELLLAQQQINDERIQFKAEANKIIENAHRLAGQLVEQAKQEAKTEVARQNKLAQEQLVQETNRARTQLRNEIAELVTISVEKIIRNHMTEELNRSLVDKLIEEI